jgi:general secretion pathway protein A
MDTNYRAFFGLQKEPFTADITIEHILVTPGVKGVSDRIHYGLRLGAVILLTGEIGSGKSTALRYVTGNLHPSEHKILPVTASAGSILELYRQIIDELGIEPIGSSRAAMISNIKREIIALVRKKRKLLLVIDEASLLRLEVFAELHTLMQFESDSKPYLTMVLAGQANLAENLKFRHSMPLASRIVGKIHLKGLSRDGMQQYLCHHLTLAGVNNNIFDDSAITAIQQGSGGLLRKANHLARGSIIVAAKQESSIVNSEHVRVASTEIL